MEQENKINLLLVDDRPENLLALEAIIEQEDYHLVKASSGEEALKYLLKYDFAAILLDVQMPGMDGIRTAKIIKAREKTKHIPILFITANNMESEHIFMGYSVGAIDYILKPFDPFVLKSKVDSFVNLYKLHHKVKHQAENLELKTLELEKVNKDLIQLTTNLRKSEAIANVISNTSQNSMFLLNQDGYILKVNPSVKRMFLYDEVEIIGKPLAMLFEEKAIENLNVTTGYKMISELEVFRADGTSFFAEVYLGSQQVDGEKIIACTIHDISERKKHEEATKYMLYHDVLTDLPNKRYFNESLVNQIKKAKRTNQPFVIMYLDLDRFKSINDSLGHIVGDKLLNAVAKRLLENVNTTDVVARVGGDEFNIVLPDTSREEALQLADKLIHAFKQPIQVDQFELFITTCIGLSVFPYDGENSEELIKHADLALYRAKKLGKDRYQLYHAGLNINSYRNFVMQNDLRKGISNNEFSIVYQPKINVATGQVESFISFLQWNHPSWGVILTEEFIPLAEETGIIVDVGKWYLKEVCKQLVEWNSKGFTNLKVGLELSTQQFLQKDIVKDIQQTLLETGVRPNQLEFAIHEKTIQDYEETVMQVLSQLQTLGIRVIIRDVGSGKLSISYLSQFPINGFSVNNRTLTRISQNKVDTEMFKEVVKLIQKLHLDVIAKNIETMEQLDFVKELQLYEAAGALFSPELQVGEVDNLLEEKKTFASILAQSTSVSKEITATIEQPTQDASAKNLKQQFFNEVLTRTKENFNITTREMEVFRLILEGLSNKEIADKLFISEHTVKNHITRIFNKLEVNDRVQAIAVVFQMNDSDGNKGEIG